MSEAGVVFVLEPAPKVREELRRGVLVSLAAVTRCHTRGGSRPCSLSPPALGRVPSGAWREGPFLSLSWPFQRLVLLSLARGPVLHLQSQQLSTCSLPAWRSRCLPL